MALTGDGYIARVRMDGCGDSAAALEARFDDLIGRMTMNTGIGYTTDEQVIEVDKEEPPGPTRYRGRRLVFLNVQPQMPAWSQPVEPFSSQPG
jgi:hypothetical protein